MNSSALSKPFLKWAGGKSQLLPDLIRRLPSDFKDYHEPFVGSGALFFELRRRGWIRKAFLSDQNAELVDAYGAIRDQVEEVINILIGYPYTEQFYYELRSKDPWQMELSERAARMIYLNKTCYNGLYRVNRQGKFNVPFGRYKLPKYYDPDNLRAVSCALRGIDIACRSFDSVLEYAKPGDLVYFDPPYEPISSTANFTSYQPNGFSRADQLRLHKVYTELTKRGVNCMKSNSGTQFIKALYADFTQNRVQATRSINSNPNRRGKITELIIINYPVATAAQLRLLERRAALMLSA